MLTMAMETTMERTPSSSDQSVSTQGTIGGGQQGVGGHVLQVGFLGGQWSDVTLVAQTVDSNQDKQDVNTDSNSNTNDNENNTTTTHFRLHRLILSQSPLLNHLMTAHATMPGGSLVVPFPPPATPDAVSLCIASLYAQPIDLHSLSIQSLMAVLATAHVRHLNAQ